MVAETYILNENAYAAPEGISGLIDLTNELMPEGIRAAVLGPTEIAEINAIAKIYGIKNNEESRRLLNSIVEVGTVSATAKVAISALKAVPGINLGASAVNAIIAGSIVAALGEGSIYIFEQIYLGNKTVRDIDWVTKMLESRLASSFMEKTRSVLENTKDGMNAKEIAKILIDVFLSSDKHTKSS